MTRLIEYGEIDRCLGDLINSEAISTTVFISPQEIIRAVRRRYNKKIREGNIEIMLTVGKPNYREREFIKLCKKAKEPFPIKKIQLKFMKGNCK
jgi:hypothetical protein